MNFQSKPAGAVLLIGFCTLATAVSHVLWILLMGELCCNLLREKAGNRKLLKGQREKKADGSLS